jgi:hypothetical protein
MAARDNEKQERGWSKKDNPVTHKFTVGQTVSLERQMLRSAAAGDYEILHLMPVSDNGSDEPRYRVKSVAESHERIVPECDLTLSARPPSMFS